MPPRTSRSKPRSEPPGVRACEPGRPPIEAIAGPCGADRVGDTTRLSTIDSHHRNLPTRQEVAPPVKPAVVDTRSAADYLGVQAGTLAKWRCVGRGPRFCRLSPRSIRYLLADLDAWIVAQRRRSTADRGPLEMP